MNQQSTPIHVIMVVVYTLGIIAVMTAGGIVFLTYLKTPAELMLPVVSVCSGAMGIIGGMLINPKSVPPSASSSTVTQTTETAVTQPPHEN